MSMAESVTAGDGVAPKGASAVGLPDLHCVGLTKTFGHNTVVDRIDFEVQDGEFVSIVGPSGCGKTTTLRMIAGLEDATAGTVFLKGRDVTKLPPEKRNTAMVFQSYALFPHMTVLQNVAFGLRMRKVGRAEARDRAREALKRSRLEGFNDRKPSQLSGGQRQRVAVARALVVEPDVLLLDEALTNLDRRLRQELQLELKRLQHELGITSLFVTHDQEEALTLSDRVIVMDQGVIAQVAPPREIYDRPASAFVAGFIGESNRFTGVASDVHEGGRCTVSTDDGIVIMGTGSDVRDGGRCTALARPRNVLVRAEPVEGMNCIAGVVGVWGYKGDSYEYIVELTGGRRVNAMVPRRDAHPDTGDAVYVVIDPQDVYVLPEAEG
jgi:spermidine/putrescine ABC transporter ATP-binding subunit